MLNKLWCYQTLISCYIYYVYNVYEKYISQISWVVLMQFDFSVQRWIICKVITTVHIGKTNWVGYIAEKQTNIQT